MSVQTIPKRSDRPVEIDSGSRRLAGILTVPAGAESVVVFAHGSGSGRLSPRNQLAARALQEAGFATLLLDLLGEQEAEDRQKVFDVELLAGRLQSAAEWLFRTPQTRSLRLGYFGASTGAAAALIAAARQPLVTGAVVSRGGRPDLAGDYLLGVTAPTLLIVGGKDEIVMGLNEAALAFLPCRKQLAVIPGATHLFPEPGALEQVARLAANWFHRHLRSTAGEKPAHASVSTCEKAVNW
jgi:putative phosphoribosyl transferase